MVGLIRIPRDTRATTTTETAIGFRGDADLENGEKKEIAGVLPRLPRSIEKFPVQGNEQGNFPVEKNSDRESRMNTGDSQLTRELAGKQQGTCLRERGGSAPVVHIPENEQTDSVLLPTATVLPRTVRRHKGFEDLHDPRVH